MTHPSSPSRTEGLLDLDWKSLKLFRIVAQSESLRAAAEKAGQAHNTVSRKIMALETALHRVLIMRSHEGIRLTPEGQQLLKEIEKMELILVDFAHSFDQAKQELAGVVEIASLDSLSAFWLAPAVAGFHDMYPGIILSFKTTSEIVDVLRMEADLAIQSTRPTSPGAMMRKLGRLHLLPFASRTYLEKHGVPKLTDDIGQHRFVVLETSPIPAPQMEGLVREIQRQDAAMTKVASGATQVWAVAHGAGIGWLPSFSYSVHPDLVPLTNGFRMTCDLWLTYHPDAGRIPRIRRVIDWVVERFDHMRFPWFRDQPTSTSEAE